MFEWLKRFDDLIVSFFEAICHKIQVFCGITSFTIAKVLVLLSVLAYIEQDVINLGRGAWAVSEIAVRIFIVFQVERMTKFTYGVSFANPARYIDVFLLLRLYFLAMVFNDAARNIRGLYESVFIWLFYVIIACAPLPPRESKLRSFFRSLNPAKLVHENAH